MSDKAHKIETMQDVVDATNPDNLEAFLSDLRLMLMNCHLVKAVEPDAKFASFVWTDDGKESGTVRINEDCFLQLKKDQE